MKQEKKGVSGEVKSLGMAYILVDAECFLLP